MRVPPIAFLIMHTRVISVSGHTSDRGLSVFAKNSLGNTVPVMFGNEPVTDGVFRVDELLRAHQALETAICALEGQRLDLGPSAMLDNAINELNYLQIRLDGMVKSSAVMHGSVVECMAVEKPDLMQSYLSAFAKAVGQGEV
jgi:hypothetical protein